MQNYYSAVPEHLYWIYGVKSVQPNSKDSYELVEWKKYCKLLHFSMSNIVIIHLLYLSIHM